MLQLSSEQKSHCKPACPDEGQDDCDDNAGNEDCGCDKKKKYCSINPCEKAVDLLYGVDKNVESVKCNVKDIKVEQKEQGKDLDKILGIVKENQ